MVVSPIATPIFFAVLSIKPAVFAWVVWSSFASLHNTPMMVSRVSRSRFDSGLSLWLPLPHDSSKTAISTAIGTGGTIGLNLNNRENSTDCNARVTVTGSTDRVFISGQLDQEITYDVPAGTGELTIYVRVNRYRGFINTDPVNPDYLFDPDGPNYTIAEKVYVRPGLTSTGTLDSIETVFSTLIDQPTAYNNDPLTPWTAYYWYILEVTYESTGASVVNVTSDKFGLRSLSSQVVKQ